MNTKEIGKLGEDKAVQYLLKNGFTILERNYRFEKGEIDIIAMEKNVLVFVEVKTSEQRNDLPIEKRISPKQEETLRRTAYAYTYERQLTSLPARFDLIEVILEEDALFHYENIFL